MSDATAPSPTLTPEQYNQLQAEREAAAEEERIAAARHGDLAQRLATHTAAEAARQHERAVAWDAAFALSASAELEAIRAAGAEDRTAFVQAAVDTPFIAAWIQSRASRYRQANLARDALSSHNRAGAAGAPPPEIDAFRGPDLLDDLRAAADAEAERVGALDSDERTAAREMYARGDSDTLPGAP